MDENSLMSQLEEVAQSLGIEVRYEPIKKEGRFYPGGLCWLKGEYVLILNSAATPRDRIRILARTLRRFDLSQIYMKPGLRDLLDTFHEQES